MSAGRGGVMPTIDELAPAIAAADNDVLAASQNGTVRKLTRAQMLAGVQPALAVRPGQLLGRASAGTGTPEAIAVGGNLTLANGVLSANAAPFLIPGLPAGSVPGGNDLVPVGQGGGNRRVTYGQFMAGLAGLGGLDVSVLGAKATGAVSVRSLAAFFADAVSVESFGATGDGVTDDTFALNAAVASGKPLRFGAKTYLVSGQWTVGQPVVLLGVPGSTVLKRVSQSGNGAWISLQGSSVVAHGIIFDANRAAITQESWSILVTASCTRSRFSACVFANGRGSVQGDGLTIQGSDPASSQHVVEGCEFSGNDAHGLWVQAVRGVRLGVEHQQPA